MLPWIVVDTTRLPNGAEFSLVRRGDEWCVRVGSMLLMSSRQHASEEALAQRVLERVRAPRHVLVGGLGLGYTLHAVQSCVAPTTRITVCELVPAVVEWNRRHVGALAGHPLDHPRTDVVVGDVLEHVAASRAAYDAILLDVDNGPSAADETVNNHGLYTARGTRTLRQGLRPGGILAVWSAGPSVDYEFKLRRAGFAAESVSVSASGRGRARHWLLLGTTPAPR